MDPVFDDPLVTALLDLALREDLGTGDRTSQTTVPAHVRARGQLLAKQSLVVCGLPLIERVYARLGEVAVGLRVSDGQRVDAGDVLGVVEGQARALLAGERLVLNLVQHLSGIATLTQAYVAQVAGTGVVIRDTRKTIPGLRRLAKYAVRTGGGSNHRLALDDAILVKDNHIDLAGGDLVAAVAAARAQFPDLPLEVEARTLAEVERAIAARPDLILLDNMSIDELAAAARLVAGRIPLEASGGIGLHNLAAVARTGVRFVAIGAITHSAPAVDVNLKLQAIG